MVTMLIRKNVVVTGLTVVATFMDDGINVALLWIES